MERLTSRSPLTESQAMNLSLTDLYMRLKAYEDAEEQGRLVVLPCKVGDKLFELFQGYIESITVMRVRPCIMTELVSFFPEEIGETVFLTREEAEKALEVKA